MTTDRLIDETTVLIQRANLYLGDLRIAKGWEATVVPMGGAHPDAERNHAAAMERVARSYAELLKAALDLFEDGDLFDKWQSACKDAGMEIEK